MTKELQICSYREYLCNYLSKKFTKARKEDIEDAVQNALLKAFRFYDSWQGDCSLKTWLSVIAVNMYTDTFRKRYSKNEYLFDSAEDFHLFEKIAENDFSETLCNSNCQKELINELLQGFEDNLHIQAFCLNVIDEIDYKDIATKYNIPLGTVKSRVFRAKKLLQEKYRSICHKYDESAV